MSADDAAGNISAIIVSGGRSERFGSDKAAIKLDGRTLIEHVLDAVAPVVDDVVVVGPWAPNGLAASIEPEPLEGPLGALAWGLELCSSPHALLVACDHPLLVPGLLREFVRMRGDADAVVARADGRPEPLVAVYSHDCLSVANALLDSGERSMRALLAAIDVRWIDPHEWRVHDPNGNSFVDIDTPEDLERLTGGRLE